MNIFSTSRPRRLKIEGSGIGGCSPLRVEVDLLTHQLLERFNFRTNENMQFRGKQAYYICNTLLNLRYLRFVFLK